MEEKVIATAKGYAQVWNTFRLETTDVLQLSDLKTAAKLKKMPYVEKIIPLLGKHGHLIRLEGGQEVPWAGRRKIVCKFSDKPIHYSLFTQIIENQRRANKTERQVVSLECISDEALVKELRDRGYEVSATKLIEL